MSHLNMGQNTEKHQFWIESTPQFWWQQSHLILLINLSNAVQD